jgi:hypothetical protein
LDGFIECWDGLDDPRTGNAALHDFHEILATAMCAVLCGRQGAHHFVTNYFKTTPPVAPAGPFLFGYTSTSRQKHDFAPERS